jgi:hypothetical protein
MKKITFYRWLYWQRKRDDPIGDFARDTYLNNDGESKLKNLPSVWRNHLYRFGACGDAIEAFEDAWKEYLDRKIQFKLQSRLRCRLFQALKGGVKTGSHIKDMGCSLEELKIHIEKQFKKGMNWNNWGLADINKKTWHIDHVKPLSLFDLTKKEQFLQACHYTNLQPMWAIENIKKGGLNKTRN